MAKLKRTASTEPTRRGFIKAAGVAPAAIAGAFTTEANAAVGDASAFDETVDVVVVGGGGGGLPSALFSRWLGNSVMLLEKAASLGGTSFKAAYWYWVPNNAAMRAAGIEDSKSDFLRYVARLTAPQTFDPNHPRFGLNEWEFAMCEAIYDSASPAAELLADKGALPYRHLAEIPDYFSELGDKGRAGRVLFPRDGAASMSDGGQVATRTLSAAARRDGVLIRMEHRVTGVIRDGSGAVIGVEADTGEAKIRVRARKGVIFATGGFTHDPELRSNFLNVPVYGGCATLSNEGDFVRISSTLGVQLRNMNHAWMCPISLEKAVNKDGSMSGMFSAAGDSMIFVNKYGRRVVSEKLNYNELAQKFFEWDGQRAEYPNLVLISIWDQRSQTHSASAEFGRMIVPPGVDDRHVIKGATLQELASAIEARLKRYAGVTGGLALSPDFMGTLKATMARFNQHARDGRDPDFHRGESTIEQLLNGDVKPEAGRRNATMWPISETGPYFAALVTGGTLDTKGGPRTSPDGQILDIANQPISGLFGVGNCVASASGAAYWAGGATLGPILAFAYRTANAVDKEPRRA